MILYLTDILTDIKSFAIHKAEVRFKKKSVADAGNKINAGA